VRTRGTSARPFARPKDCCRRQLSRATGDRTPSSFISLILHLSHPVRKRVAARQFSVSLVPHNLRFLRLNQRIMQSKQVTETDASSITTVTLASLPPHPHGRHPSRLSTFRGDQAPRIYVHPNGRCADVVFADAHGVKRTLNAYAEQPLRVRGREIIVFQKYMNCGGIEL
jgi:hypothetical protein